MPATSTTPAPSSLRAGVPGRTLVPSDDFIDQQIQRTRRTVKAVDVASSLLVLATVVLGSLLLFAIVEHWLVPGGLSVVIRCLLLAGLVSYVGFYAWRQLWPYIVQRVNPAFAAHAIERHNPSLKNSLLNYLLLSRRRAEVPDAVYHTLGQQAAEGLAHVSVDTAVDRSRLIRIASAFAAIIVVGALYKILSPLDPFTSAGRVLLPWAEIAAPSRVAIQDVQPGTANVTQGDVVELSAVILNLAEDDEVFVRYSTEDRRIVEQPVAMRASPSGIRFACELPAPLSPSASEGVQRNLRYRIEAGDARTRDFELTVVAAPTITVSRIDYDFPAYTGYLDLSVDGMGDIRAIEGSRVTVHAQSNGPIDEAYVDFEMDGRRDLTMQHEDRQAQVDFELSLRADRQTSQHTNYALRVIDDQGQTNRRPAQYTIDVVPDYAPEVEILAPEPSRDIHLNETVSIEIDARDPDFALGEVLLVGEVGGKRVVEESLLDRVHSGRFVRTLRFTPSRYGLRAGDEMLYWTVARDNRTPQANQTESRRQRLRVVSPAPNQPPPEDQLANQRPSEDQRNQQESHQDGENGGENGQPGGEAGDAGADQGSDQPGQSRQSSNSEQQREGSQSAGETGDGTENREGKNRSDAGSQGGERAGSEASESPSAQGGDDQERRPGEQSGSRQGNSRNSQQQDGERRTAEAQQRDGQQESTEDSTPVSPEGDNDAEAFQRIARHLSEKSDQGSEQPQESPDGTDSRQGGPAERSPQSDANARRGNEGDMSNQRSPQERRAQEQPDAQQQQALREQQGTEERERVGGGERSEEGPSDSQSDGSPSSPASAPNERSGSDDATGEEPRSEGATGSGDQSRQDRGSPNPGESPEEQDQRWQQDPSSDSQGADDGRRPEPGQEKREQATKGDQGADDPGGGQQGTGEQSENEGTGSSGTSTSADEGAGESGERGTGRTSTGAGKEQASDTSTGRPGESAGEAAERREGSGEQRGGEEGQEPGGEGRNLQGERDPSPQSGSEVQPGDESTSPSADGDGRQAGEQQASDADSQRQPNGRPQGGTSSGGGGQFGRDTEPATVNRQGEPGGDEPNLEYARRQTDLVLDKLSDMLKKKQVDEDLLNKLGWQDEDLRRFVERWQSRRSAAQSGDPQDAAAQQEWTDALRSLGLKPRDLGGQTIRTEDALRDLREGVRMTVPPQFRDRLRFYNQGVSRVREDD